VAHHIFLPFPPKERLQDQRSPPRLRRPFHVLRISETVPSAEACAPHYYRILRQRARRKEESRLRNTGWTPDRGCQEASPSFISHGPGSALRLPELNCGNVRDRSRRSGPPPEIFRNLRQVDHFRKCGRREFRKVCRLPRQGLRLGSHVRRALLHLYFESLLRSNGSHLNSSWPCPVGPDHLCDLVVHHGQGNEVLQGQMEITGNG
jgi:hypothetical protein